MKAIAHLLALAAASLGLLHAAAFAAPQSCPPTASMPTPEQVQAGAKAARDHGFLWRLRKDGRESWLYGTVHVARFEWAFPGPTVLSALKASDTVALELDVLDPEIQRRMKEAVSPAAAITLPDSLKQRLQRQAEAECLPPQALDGMSPEMQVATLESLIGRRDGLDPSYGIDIVLDGWARASKKPVVSLETPELQLATLAMPSPAETLEFVDSSLTEIETGQAAPSLKQIAQVWADGNLERLSHYRSWCGCVNTQADRVAMKRLLDDRNPGLADSIAALHGSGQRVFAAVGSLHMIGPLGLPNLLAQRGFEVHAVAFPRR
jgi:uncharacterized protein YbaP (TraB family)